MSFMKMLYRNEKQKELEKWRLNKGLLVEVPGFMREEDELRKSKLTEPRSHVSSQGEPWVPSLSGPIVPEDCLLWQQITCAIGHLLGRV